MSIGGVSVSTLLDGGKLLVLTRAITHPGHVRIRVEVGKEKLADSLVSIDRFSELLRLINLPQEPST